MTREYVGVYLYNVFCKSMSSMTIKSFCSDNVTVAVPCHGSKFGEKIQPMEFGGLQCTGTESSLQQCTVGSSFVRTWSQHFFSNHEDYAGVRCIHRRAGKYVAVYLTVSTAYVP